MNRVWRWRQQQWEGRTGTHERLWTWQQHERRVRGAHGRLRAWQQQMGGP
ncbi:unnamed protein product [Staurois parvus]|uniref:Uncharacterized protein n=1 Tax=Staurois parvus TaxID=386267 RepID=A0ABN9GMM0_9NEOB|nr:unnamed protein product [Staurois parvus]